MRLRHLVETVFHLTFVLWGYSRWIPICTGFSKDYKTLVTVSYTHYTESEIGLYRGVFGQWMDLKDAQWQSFRHSLPLMCMVFGGMVVATHLVRRFVTDPVRAARVRSQGYVILSIAALLFLHEAGCVWLFLLLSLNYLMASVLAGSQRGAALMWGLHLAVLWAVNYKTALRFGNIPFVGSTLSFLDELKGEMPWASPYPLCMLRMMSYNMDLHWSRRRRCPRPQTHKNPSSTSSSNETASPSHSAPAPPNSPPSNSSSGANAAPVKLSVDPVCAWTCTMNSGSNSLSARVKQTRAPTEYSFISYWAFVTYLPLYVAGPISSFNSFQSYMVKPQTDHSWKGILFYAARFLVLLSIMELYLSFLYVPAIAINEMPEQGFVIHTPLQAASYALAGICFLWLKFSTFWKFFRLVALLDGVDTVENMTRCVKNNYRLTDFWRHWHVSFHKWLVRYVYVPIGGRGHNLLHRALNVFLVFAFVAMWHDVKLKLFMWALGLSVFFLVEFLADYLAGLCLLRRYWWSRYVIAAGGSLNIMLMIAVNLIGYLSGVEGTEKLVKMQLWSWAGAQAMGVSFALLFCTVCLMLDIEQARAPRPELKVH